MSLEDNLRNFLENYLGQYLENSLGNFLKKYLGFINSYPAISTFIIVVLVLMMFFLAYLFFIGDKRIFRIKIKGRLFTAFGSLVLTLIITSVFLSILFISKIDDKQLSSLIWIMAFLPLAISILFSLLYIFSISRSFHKYIDRLKSKIYEEATEQLDTE